MPIRCITFDLDDTLWDTGPVLATAEKALYTWLSECCPRIARDHTQASLSIHRQRFYKTLPQLKHDLTALRKHWLKRLAIENQASPEAIVEPGFRVFWEHRNTVKPYSGVPDLLRTLHLRHQLGVITNGNADLHYIGLSHHFDFIVSASSAGAAKPDPGIFQAALQICGCEPNNVLHVGDDPERDITAAAALGMRTVWINANDRCWCNGLPPDMTVRSVNQLPEVLQGEGL